VGAQGIIIGMAFNNYLLTLVREEWDAKAQHCAGKSSKGILS
jgi:hypothetical protein